MSHKNYTCQNCKKSFNTHEVYLWGKDKHSFCQSCNEKNKKRCSWCEKNLNCPSNLHKHQREWKWYNDNGECCHEAFCDEKCQNELQKHRGGKAEDIFEQNREELLKKGYKKLWAKLEVVGWTLYRTYFAPPK